MVCVCDGVLGYGGKELSGVVARGKKRGLLWGCQERLGMR